ncbi:MAG TPA: serine hydrolase [Gordonia sp. (in: high G+C Gram-positive bacteria)]|nr:serine hydrolase [Gordonia sp. (in: high G+C Gram-positive bacteria)]HNP55424.1 serine hydrolase [Gordonia sp. (in: high G+C Gram-positive bacteria)]HRC51622.1 serine hydrolase [Gordonia sp. (in: high G+C Gram-positive bacteria)]
MSVLLAAGVLVGATTALANPPGFNPYVAPTTPATDHCPHQTKTPPAVDTSEVPKPGQVAPAPLPVPEPPIGGAKLAACGVVVADGMGAPPHKLTSAAWLVADMGTGEILAAKDPHGRYRPASTIKVLLALVALDELDLTAPVTVHREEYETEGDSCGTGPRGHYTNRDMVTGLLMASGNDCAMVIARELGGVDKTLAKMNARAKDLGALDTRAASPSGLDAPGMSTSAYDLAVIFRAAMRNETFREIIGKRQYRFPGYPPRPEIPHDPDHPAYDMFTSNNLLAEGFPGMLGGKTGYTDDALKTFVGAAHVGGRDVLIVQMYGLSVETSSYWTQAKDLLAWGGRAPAGASIGTLNATGDDKSGESTTTTNAAERPVAGPAPEAPADDSSGIFDNTFVLGLLWAITVCALGYLGIRVLARRP